MDGCYCNYKLRAWPDALALPLPLRFPYNNSNPLILTSAPNRVSCPYHDPSPPHEARLHRNVESYKRHVNRQGHKQADLRGIGVYRTRMRVRVTNKDFERQRSMEGFDNRLELRSGFRVELH